MTKPPRDPADKPKDLPLDKASTVGRDGNEEGVVVIAAGTPGGVPAPSTTTTTTNTSKPGSPAALSPSPSAPDQKRAGLDMTSQGVQTTATQSTFSGPKHEEKEEKKEAVQEWVECWEGRLYIFKGYVWWYFVGQTTSHQTWSWYILFFAIYVQCGPKMMILTRATNVHKSTIENCNINSRLILFKWWLFHCLFSIAVKWENQPWTRMPMSSNLGSIHRSVCHPAARLHN